MWLYADHHDHEFSLALGIGIFLSFYGYHRNIVKSKSTSLEGEMHVCWLVVSICLAQSSLYS